MRMKKQDYGSIARQSVRRDFNRKQPKQVKRAIEEPRQYSERRIAFVNDNSAYYKYKSLLLGRLVRLVEKTTSGWKCEFIHNDDSLALNSAAGWSSKKKEYIFDSVKFK